MGRGRVVSFPKPRLNIARLFDGAMVASSWTSGHASSNVTMLRLGKAYRQRHSARMSFDAFSVLHNVSL